MESLNEIFSESRDEKVLGRSVTREDLLSDLVN